MAIFQKKRDPILDREAKLERELAEVKARIRELDATLRSEAEAAPKMRSTARPGSGAAPARPVDEPGWEDLRPRGPGNPFTEPRTAVRHDAKGTARFDLVGTLRAWGSRLRRKPSRNPELVTYLAAGGIQGLPALRHERRVARNRFFIICAALAVVFLGIIYWWPAGR